MAGAEEECEIGMTVRKEDEAKRRERKEVRQAVRLWQQELWQPILRFGAESCQACSRQVILSPSKRGTETGQHPAAAVMSATSCQPVSWLEREVNGPLKAMNAFPTLASPQPPRTSIQHLWKQIKRQHRLCRWKRNPIPKQRFCSLKG